MFIICTTVFNNGIQMCYSTLLSYDIFISSVIYIVIICTHVFNSVIQHCYRTSLSYVICISAVLYIFNMCTIIINNGCQHCYITSTLYLRYYIYIHHLHTCIQHYCSPLLFNIVIVCHLHICCTIYIVVICTTVSNRVMQQCCCNPHSCGTIYCRHMHKCIQQCYRTSSLCLR